MKLKVLEILRTELDDEYDALQIALTTLQMQVDNLRSHVITSNSIPVRETMNRVMIHLDKIDTLDLIYTKVKVLPSKK